MYAQLHLSERSLEYLLQEDFSELKGHLQYSPSDGSFPNTLSQSHTESMCVCALNIISGRVFFWWDDWPSVVVYETMPVTVKGMLNKFSVSLRSKHVRNYGNSGSISSFVDIYLASFFLFSRIPAKKMVCPKSGWESDYDRLWIYESSHEEFLNIWNSLKLITMPLDDQQKGNNTVQ